MEKDNNGYLPFPKGFSTATIHGSQDSDQCNDLSINPPIVTSAAFKQRCPINFEKYIYGRYGNPTRNTLEDSLANLEGAKYGICFSSGMGASSAILGMLKTDDHIICNEDVYPANTLLFSNIASSKGILTTFTDLTDISNLEKALRVATKIIWIESPTNPHLNVLDIQAIAQIAHKFNTFLVVDNTFLTPYLQRPLTLGADIVVYSLTKYMNGHSDVIMGAVLVNKPELHEKLRLVQYTMGAIPSPFDCSQVIRSLTTLTIRLDKHRSNSLIVAKYLENHPKVIRVTHPELPSHPGYELYKKQTSGHSGVVTIYIKGQLEASRKFMSALKLFNICASLGGTKSLATLPYPLTKELFQDLEYCDSGDILGPKSERKILTYKENLIRLSIGLEDVNDLIADLEQALNHI